MRKVVICLNPFESHFLPMIPFADYIQNREFDIVFMGYENLEYKVKKEGFSFLSISASLDIQLQKLKKEKKYKEMELVYERLHQEIYEKISEYKPDFILMGISRFQLYLLPALRCNSKIFFYSLCGGIPFSNKDSPPITSDYIGQANLLGNINNLNQWFHKWKRKGINKKILHERKFYPWNEIKKICRTERRKWKLGVDGYYPDYPVLIFGTRYFDVCQNRELNYLGVDIRKDNELFEFKRVTDTEKLIYCSFGTMSDRYENIEEFIINLLDIFREKKEWKLVISIGNKIDCSNFDVSSNVTIYKFAPQVAILKKADLAITHGGYGTVKECISLRIPMLVLPCMYDQRGNAARVEFLHLGIRDLMLEANGNTKKKKIDKRHIEELLIKLLSDSTYKENLNGLLDQIKEQKEMEVTINKLFK